MCSIFATLYKYCYVFATNILICHKMPLTLQTNSKTYFTMKFYIDYIDKSGDYSKVWVSADSKEDAIREAKSEYWDIQEIISVRKA